MKKYRVGIPVYGYLVYEVVAESKDEAVDCAFPDEIPLYSSNFMFLDYDLTITDMVIEIDSEGNAI